MTISIEEAQKTLPELIDQALPGQEIVITRDKRPVAQLIPVYAAKTHAEFGNCQGMLSILSEDDQHLEDFRNYMP